MNNTDAQPHNTRDENGKELPSSKIWREDMLPHNFELLTTANQEVQEVNESMEERWLNSGASKRMSHILNNEVLATLHTEIDIALFVQKKQILGILVDEIAIAHTHNQQTSRITSAYNRIEKIDK
jgi:hypothetical protein